MANLFVVFTPLQLLVAQQIIRQEKLTNNFMLESYTGNHTHFLSIYQLIRNDEFWDGVISFDNWPNWDFSGEKLFKNSFKVYQRARKIKKILKENNIETIYLADFQNQTNRFSCIWLSKLGYKIVFYEEGYSHYIPRLGYPPVKGFLHDVYERVLDLCYYRPLYHINFAHWRCYVNKDYHGLPIYRRYSILPDVHHESYDRILKYSPIVSSGIKALINEEVACEEGEKVLLLTDPMTEVLDYQYKHLYFETIKEYVAKYTSAHMYIKFHPRDSVEDRDIIEKMLKDMGVRYSILGARVNIPVEFYLQNTSFSCVLFFNTSTYFYNGYLFPKVDFVKLLPVLYEKCIINRVPNLKQMEMLIEKL